MPSFGQWQYINDRDATVAAYSRATGGYTSECDCTFCRNFILVRASVFPPQFIALLDKLGIDPSKDAEVYHEGAVAPQSHYYGGWYHFVGSLETTGDFAPVSYGDQLSAYMCRARAPRLPALADMAVVQLEFRAEGVPWKLDEEEPL
jgi:hypothetical protein